MPEKTLSKTLEKHRFSPPPAASVDNGLALMLWQLDPRNWSPSERRSAAFDLGQLRAKRCLATRANTPRSETPVT
jgi:hypothetical protein